MACAKLLCLSTFLAVPYALGQCPSATFSGLGPVPGSSGSFAQAVSADGQVVIGGSSDGYRAFRWSAVLGMQDLGVLPGYQWSRAYGVSDDGSVIAGFSSASDLSGNYARAFRWTDAMGLQPIDGYGLTAGPYLPSSYAFAVSGDGSVLAGGIASDRGFRWTAATGMQELASCPPCLGSARGMSSDGAVLVGDGCTGNACLSHVWKWTAASVTYLYAPGATELGVSGNGTVTIGTRSAAGTQTAVRWSADDTLQDLAPATLSGPRFALGANEDGSVIVGTTNDQRAFIWTSALGVLDLRTVLLLGGVQLEPWNLTQASGISSDGGTVVGQGEHSYTTGSPPRTEAWRATVPFLLATNPTARQTCVGAVETLSVSAVGTAAPFSFTWRRNGIVLSNDDRHDVTVSTDGRSSSLTISGFLTTDVGAYDCTVSSVPAPCWSSTTATALVTACIADFNCSNSLSVQDIFDFLAAFFASSSIADTNGSGQLTVQDLFDFLAAYFAGC